MSALVGIYYPDGRKVEPMDLQRMVASVAHRGPDGVGMWSMGCIGLGHRILWTTPESPHETLPLVNQTGDLVITADARIDNRDELIAALQMRDLFPPPITDSQLILAAYEKWGEAAPEKLLGDFAFAIWDARQQLLFCARDPIGVKPFYYYRSTRSFLFASEIKALLCLPEVPRRLNEVRVADHLMAMFDDRAITFYRDILRLPAGHCLTLRRQEARLQPYWALDPLRELRLRSDEEYAEAFREVFTKAVQCRLRSAFPVGSMLSGGLDSSSIACMARHLLAQEGERRLHSFSAIFPSLPQADLRKLDERSYIQAVLSIGGFAPDYVHADRLSPLAELDRVLWHEDEAVLAPNLYIHWGLYHAAHARGVRVLLDGIDGDTTVSHGWERLMELVRTGRWWTLAQEASAVSRKATAAFPPRRIIWEYGLKPLLPEAALRAWEVLHGCIRPGGVDGAALHPGFAERIGLRERRAALRQNALTSAYTARARHSLALRSPLIPYALEVLDKATTAFSLEVRYPFFDRRLMEFCLALPPEQKLHQGWNRIVMRRAMGGLLPEAIRWRFSKANLTPNFNRRLIDGDREIIEEAILHHTQAIESYVDLAALRGMYQRYTLEPMRRGQEALTIYGVAMLARWLHGANLKT